MKELKPTLFMTVPSILNAISQKVTMKFDRLSGFKKSVITKALNSKLSSYDKNGKVTSKFWDSMAFSKVRKRFGGRLRLIGVGGASVSADVYRFLQVILSVHIVEVYGLTECASICFAR